MAGLSFGDQARVTASVVAALSAPGVPAALLDRTELDQGVRTAAVELVDGVHEALTEGVEGARRAEQDADAEQVVESESAWHTDPPEGAAVTNPFTFTAEAVDIEQVLAEQSALTEDGEAPENGGLAENGEASEGGGERGE